jgi:hypothetical protein
MSHRLPMTLATVALCAGWACSASAASTQVVAVTLDTAAIVAGGNGFTGNAAGGFSDPFSVELAVGDTLDLTIDFLGDQTVTIEGLDTIWAFSFADKVSDVTGTGKFQFLGASGEVLVESLERTTTEGTVHFGQFFYADDFVNLPQVITFSGVRYVGTVVEYIDPGVTSRIYNEPGFAFDSAGFTAAVPEPGSWALMLAGVGLLASAVRRRG